MINTVILLKYYLMKKIIASLIFLLFMTNIGAQGLISNMGQMSLKTNSNTIDVEIVNIAREQVELPFSSDKSQTLPISLFLPDHNTFIVHSDVDSISFTLPLGNSISVLIEKDGMQPVVIDINNGFIFQKLEFDTTHKNEDMKIVYEEDINNPYLVQLRKEYPIDSIASTENTDLGKIRKIASWVHSLWKHDGMNEPEKKDALYILHEVAKGKRFRCVEYGIVTSACLNSIGIKARTLSLRTSDVETRPVGAGHVLLEAYVNDLNKWIMIDPQWDIIPHINGTPLNAVELQSGITNSENVDIMTTEEASAGEYFAWIYPYLYYFSVKFDNRENVPAEDRHTYKGKTNLMLVPIGAKNPTIFQQKDPIDYCIYTNSLRDFYTKP